MTKEELKEFVGAWVETLFVRGVPVEIDSMKFIVQTRHKFNDISNLKAMLHQKQNIEFRAANNEIYTLTPSQFRELYNQVMKRRLFIINKSFAVRALVESGTITTQSQIINEANWT